MPTPRFWPSFVVAAIVLACGHPAAADAPTSFDEHTLYALSTEDGGTQVRLDVDPDKKHVVMRPAGKVTGQLWRIRHSDRGTWVFGTSFTGDCKRLAIASSGTEDTVVMKMKQDDSKDQNWTIRPTSDKQFVRLSSELRGTQFALSATTGTTGPTALRVVPIAKDPQQHWTITPLATVKGDGRCLSR